MTTRACPESGLITLLFDPDLRAPACVLLQAVAGLWHGPAVSALQLFPVNTWIVEPTPGLRRVSGTREQWERVARRMIPQPEEPIQCI